MNNTIYDENFITNEIDDLPDEVFQKNCYVFFSGGADSTAVLELVSYRCSKLKLPCTAVTFNATHYDQNKYAKESTARENIISNLRERGRWIEELFVSLTTFNDRCKIVFPIRSGYSALPQQLSWFANSLLFMENDCSLFFGYNKDDSNFWRHLHYFNKIYSSVIHLAGKLSARIYLPLAFHSKVSVLDYLHEQCLDDFTWSCENYSYIDRTKLDQKLCGHCSSCRLNVSALVQLYQKIGDINKQKWILDKLKNIYDIDLSNINKSDNKQINDSEIFEDYDTKYNIFFD